jgi:hypothetical protein
MSVSEDRPSATFDWTAFEGPSTAVVTAVAEESDEDPVALSPLYEVVDPDSLDSIFAPVSESTRVPTGSIQFEYHDYSVIIKANGRGYLYEQNNAQQATPTSATLEAREDD